MEYIADMAVHATGLTLAVLGLPLLLYFGLQGADAPTLISLPLYAFGLLAMLTFSALYNLTHAGRWKEFWRRCDQVAILSLIAGTYSPFALSAIGGAWGLGVFVFVWGAAAAGAFGIFAFARRFERFMIALCLAMGWSIVVAIGPLVDAVSARTLALLTIGGVLYTAGVAFHVAERLPFNNAVWHTFVVAAAGCHFAAMFDTTVAASA